MSLHLTDYNAIYFHIQKTGGRWVGGALTRAGVKIETKHNLGGNKNAYHSLVKHIDLSKQFLFTFVRHPVAWYRSYWAQRTETKWRKDWLDLLKADTFEGFLINILKSGRPYASEHFYYYVGHPQVLDYVGLNENMANELIKVLKILKAKFDKEKILTLPPVNTSKAKPKCSKQVLKEIIKLEQPFIFKYYKNTSYENYIYEFAEN